MPCNKLLPCVLALFALASCAGSAPSEEGPSACGALVGKTLGAGSVLQAKAAAAGQAVALAGAKHEPPAPFGFCRVEALLRSEPGSEIHAAFWLPDGGAWNGKFLALGNGGFGGLIPEPQLFAAMRQGYAVAASDMGHGASFPRVLTPMDAKWSFKQPIRIEDWAHRANHVTAVAGKELVALFYGRQPARAYFHGCSDGGREALMQAARYPQDYDGVIAGAPAAAFTDLMTQALWNARQAAATNLTEGKLRLLHAAVLGRCDALDGAKDGLIESPPACAFDPQGLSCTAGAAGDGCLAPAEVAAVRAIYQGPRTRDGQRFSAGFSPGSEYVEGWGLWITGPTLPLLGTVKSLTGGSMISTAFFRWMVHADPDWERERFDLDADRRLARERLSALIDADDRDLSAFFAGGRKLLLYHGWADAALPPLNTVGLYDRLRDRHSDAAATGLRLFMAPGMGHCIGGPGPSVFDAVGALDRWVEGGAPPQRIVAAKYDNTEAGALGLPARIERERPLCAWPKVARWSGQGSLDAASNFSCESPAPP